MSPTSRELSLYPDEAEVARRVLGARSREWAGKAAVLEREGMPKIDPLMGGAILAGRGAVVSHATWP
jgi:hypothetical protein